MTLTQVDGDDETLMSTAIGPSGQVSFAGGKSCKELRILCDIDETGLHDGLSDLMD